MKKPSTMHERKLAPYRKKLLHLAFFGSLGGLIGGWSFFDRLGPIGLILPVVVAIGTGLSEVDLLFDPVWNDRSGSPGWASREKPPLP